MLSTLRGNPRLVRVVAVAAILAGIIMTADCDGPSGPGGGWKKVGNSASQYAVP